MSDLEYNEYKVIKLESSFFIPKEFFLLVILALKKTFTEEKIPSIGEACFNEIYNAYDIDDIDDIFISFRMDLIFDEGKNIKDIYFRDLISPSLLENLFGSIAPFVREGSYIVVAKESDYSCSDRYYFNGKECIRQVPQTIWRDTYTC